jgi:hypothetical protein
MSIFKNSLGNVVPVRERREATGVLAALNQEVVLDLNGDTSAIVYVISTNFVGTLGFTGASDVPGASYFSIPAFPIAPGCLGGTIPQAAQPMLQDPLVAANTIRAYSIPVGQLRKLRIRADAYTSGNCAIHIVTDTAPALNQKTGQNSATGVQSGTAAVGVTLTLTLPSIPGLRHYIDELVITRSATAVLTASATPVVVTTTNLPGPLALTFGQDVAGIGIDREVRISGGPGGLAATALGTNTTIVMPAYVGVIWRANCLYHYGP